MISPTNPSIEAMGLSKSFGNLKAVRDVSFKVEKGEIVGLLGPNGAGKTTCLRLLSGLLSPDSGQTRICGLDLAEKPLEARALIGFSSGGTGLYPKLQVFELLDYFGRLYGMEKTDRKNRIEELLLRFELQAKRNERVSSLSSGQKQRLNLARCFLHRPPVMILDEPTATLDILSSQSVLNDISRERERGCAILFSTHILSEAERICNRMILMFKGQILDSGTLSELCERHQQETLTDIFLAASNAPRED